MKILLSMMLLCFSLGAQAQFQLLTHQEGLPCLNKKFTIVAHVVLDGNGNQNVEETQIREDLAQINTYFEPICVSFELCELKTIPNYQYDTLIVEEEWAQLQIENHLANRINLFYTTEFEGELEMFCGFASLGGIGQLGAGGIVIKCPGFNTLLHEMGHYFGLSHTFEGSGIELVNGDNCETAGDNICDTPADPFVVGEDLANYIDFENGCRFISPKVDANGEYYRPDTGNVMSYYSGCECGFTYGQYLKMAEVCKATNGRMW